MDIKKKVLIGFVVSMGLYSAANAVQYVNSLSTQEKESLMSTIKDTKAPMSVCGGSVIGVKSVA
ncbi:MAG: hypothetical protein A2V88_01445 [Elusimicrobia bacterium RBG_16_66_12]|nr:MAG: hypothetical protein A2V88_01445 [Elusimicrobia bacterium RBG_16_66_12]